MKTSVTFVEIGMVWVCPKRHFLTIFLPLFQKFSLKFSHRMSIHFNGESLIC